MRVGLYFGSFNPIHHGHLIIANHVAQNTDLDQLWFVVSPQNPLKPQTGMLNEHQRLYLIKMAIEGEKKLRATDVEFSLSKPSYTAHTLAFLEEKHRGNSWVIVMGSDSFQNISRWKNHEHLLKHYSFYIYRRPGHEIGEPPAGASVSVLHAPLLEISATHIRENVKAGRSIRYLVPDNVREEIEKAGYYRK
ncbi:MAG TPA: nicotinate (nicotinamide) nucleotide adenylyltransferase [Puia sp.]|nr:nicotinate (nicotinamide) nucleotide adenylyltransferase [Puia sp.]